jgi:di/tricarboxylate transporter
MLTVIAFFLFRRERVPLETTSLGVLVALVAGFHFFPFAFRGQTLAPVEFLPGFGRQAIITISTLMVIGRGLVTTGAFQPLSRWLGRMLDESPRTSLLAVLVFCMVLSGLVIDKRRGESARAPCGR